MIDEEETVSEDANSEDSEMENNDQLKKVKNKKEKENKEKMSSNSSNAGNSNIERGNKNVVELKKQGAVVNRSRMSGSKKNTKGDDSDSSLGKSDESKYRIEREDNDELSSVNSEEVSKKTKKEKTSGLRGNKNKKQGNSSDRSLGMADKKKMRLKRKLLKKSHL